LIDEYIENCGNRRFQTPSPERIVTISLQTNQRTVNRGSEEGNSDVARLNVCSANDEMSGKKKVSME
jgi:hypothetical protein